MSTSTSPSPTATEPQEEKKPSCRICCACTETRAQRDECIMQKGEEACADLIEAHKVCLRAEGFKV